MSIFANIFMIVLNSKIGKVKTLKILLSIADWLKFLSNSKNLMKANQTFSPIVLSSE